MDPRDSQVFRPSRNSSTGRNRRSNSISSTLSSSTSSMSSSASTPGSTSGSAANNGTITCHCTYHSPTPTPNNNSNNNNNNNNHHNSNGSQPNLSSCVNDTSRGGSGGNVGETVTPSTSSTTPANSSPPLGNIGITFRDSSKKSQDKSSVLNMFRSKMDHLRYLSILAVISTSIMGLVSENNGHCVAERVSNDGDGDHVSSAFSHMFSRYKLWTLLLYCVCSGLYVKMNSTFNRRLIQKSSLMYPLCTFNNECAKRSTLKRHLFMLELTRMIISILGISLFQYVAHTKRPMYLWATLFCCIEPIRLGIITNNILVPSLMIPLYIAIQHTIFLWIGASVVECLTSILCCFLVLYLSVIIVRYLNEVTISHQRTVEENNMKRSEDMYSVLYKIAPNALVSVSPDRYEIQHCNVAASQILGKKLSELKGTCIMDYFDFQSREIVLESIRNCATQQDSFSHCTPIHLNKERPTAEEEEQEDKETCPSKLEHNHAAKGTHHMSDEKSEHVACSSSPGVEGENCSIVSLFINAIRTPDGNIVSYNIILHDISEKISLMEQLTLEKENAVRASEAKSNFLAVMSHELKTPLNAILGMGDLLLLTSLNHEQEDYVKTICHSSKLLLGLIQDILDFTKIEAEKVELEQRPFDLMLTFEQISSGILLPQARKKGLDYNLEIDPDIHRYVIGDENRLAQIILNLCNNAIKFTSAGGVNVVVHRDDDDKLLLKQPERQLLKQSKSKKKLRASSRDNEESAEPTEEKVRIICSISDTGIGIPSDKLPQLFQSFKQADTSTTRKFGGSGLGLVISKQLIELMNGSICVQSVEGKGSIFTFSVEFKKATKIQVERRKSDSVFTQYANIFEMKATDEVIEGSNDTEQYSFQQSTTETRETLRLEETEESVEGKEEVTGETKATQTSPKLEKKSVKNGVGKLENIPILVIDDNAINLKVAVKILNYLGYLNVETAKNGNDAFEMYKRSRHKVLFVDLCMPHIDGFSTATLIRDYERDNDIQPPAVLIALTANAFQGVVQRCKAVGFDFFLTKPTKMVDMKRTMEHFGRRLTGVAQDPELRPRRNNAKNISSYSPTTTMISNNNK